MDLRMRNQNPPPSLPGERFTNWWSGQRRRTKIIVVLFFVVIVIVAISTATGAPGDEKSSPHSTPTPTLTAEESRRDYEDKMRFACSYAVAGGFDRDRMQELAEYDYGSYAGIIVKVYLKKKDIGRQCSWYR